MTLSEKNHIMSSIAVMYRLHRPLNAGEDAGWLMNAF